MSREYSDGIVVADDCGKDAPFLPEVWAEPGAVVDGRAHGAAVLDIERGALVAPVAQGAAVPAVGRAVLMPAEAQGTAVRGI